MHYFIPAPLTWKHRLVWIAPLVILAVVPIFVYLPFGDLTYIVILMLCSGCVQILLSWRTAGLAAGVMSRLRSVGGNWDLLALTGIEARSVSEYVWRSIVRQTSVDFALLTIPRLGLALVWSQFLQTRWLCSNTNSILCFPYDYYAYNTLYQLPPPTASPDAVQLLIAAAILLGFSMFEGRLIAALGVLWGSALRRNTIGAAALALFYRFGLTVVAVVFYFSTATSFAPLHGLGLEFWMRWQVGWCASIDYPSPTSSGFDWSQYQELGRFFRANGACDNAIRYLSLLRIGEAAQVTAESFLDQGALLAVNILRPLVPARADDLGGYYGTYTAQDGNYYQSYWGFVLRNVGSAVGAFAIFQALIWGSVRLTRASLNRRGLL